MALFSRKKNTETKAAAPAGLNAAPAKQELSWVLINPRITEKATDMNAARAYVFNVSPRANKQQIARAVSAVYGVRPAKVRVVSVRAKAVRNARTGSMGVKPGGKKAYVYLKEGESINVI